MVIRTNLKVVESLPFQRLDVQLWGDDAQQECHSLHYAITFPQAMRPEIASYFIERYSLKGGTVLDPFAGSGAVPFEANLFGRVGFASDIDPLAIKVVDAKLDPADITEVTLRLQTANLRRPITLSSFSEPFRPFYDIDTFRELVNLRSFLHERYDRTSRFIELVGLSLLHGHTAGFFSTYTFPQVSLRPAEQEALNLKRGQTPDFRSVIPRILRKTASMLRDGMASSLRTVSQKNRTAVTDARNLSYIPANSVDLVITAPPLPLVSSGSDDSWLRNWFAGLNQRRDGVQFASIGSWREFMNETLLELARVARPGARAVFDLREIRQNREMIRLDEIVHDDVVENLGRYWDPEMLIVNTPPTARLKHKERDLDKEGRSNRILVLRRR